MKTPYFVVNKNDMDLNFNKLKLSLEKFWDNYIIGYSYKTNSLPWIIKYFNSKGCFAEVVSEDEYDLAKYIGVKKDCIIYNGPIKSKDSFIDALKNKCIVNIDSNRELEWLTEVENNDFNIGIRVNFDIESFCPGQSQCRQDGGRFGFCYENGEFEKALNLLKKNNYKVKCLHLHVSSKTRSIEIYESIAKIACKIKKEYNLNLEYIDIGGGFFGGLNDKPQFDDYLSSISKILLTEFSPKKTTLIIEPGMSVVGAYIDYYCEVVDVKKTTFNRFVVTNGSRTNIDPLMNKKTYFYDINCNNFMPVIDKQIICGYTCMEHDRFFELFNSKELCVGDIIKFKNVGAYTMSLTPLFIKYFPDVYIYSNGEYIKVREKWTIFEYIQNDRS